RDENVPAVCESIHHQLHVHSGGADLLDIDEGLLSVGDDLQERQRERHPVDETPAFDFAELAPATCAASFGRACIRFTGRIARPDMGDGKFPVRRHGRGRSAPHQYRLQTFVEQGSQEFGTELQLDVHNRPPWSGCGADSGGKLIALWKGLSGFDFRLLTAHEIFKSGGSVLFQPLLVVSSVAYFSLINTGPFMNSLDFLHALNWLPIQLLGDNADHFTGLILYCFQQSVIVLGTPLEKLIHDKLRHLPAVDPGGLNVAPTGYCI